MNTPTIANAEQSEAWNGTTGVKWVRFQDRLDRMLAPFSDALLDAAAIKSGERVLDVGCGCGVTTIDASRFTGPAGRALGIDLSALMTTRARERNAALKTSAEFAVADAYAHDFSGDQFDCLISRFGVMFFDDPVGAFVNLHRALKPGGRMAFICWRELRDNAWISLPMAAARPLLPPIPPADPYAPGPGAFAEKARVTSILEKAGFHNVTHRELDQPLIIGETLDEALEQSMEIGPLSRLIADFDDAIKDKIRQAVREELAKHLTSDGGVKLASAAWVVSARA
jgi:SAM-dependent methyltransferase